MPIESDGSPIVAKLPCDAQVTAYLQVEAAAGQVIEARSFHVLPQMGPLTRVDAAVDSVAGRIDLQLRRSDQSFTLTLDAPDETTATVGIPGRPRTIELDGQTIWRDGQPAALPEGVAWVGRREQWACFAVGGGTWRFKASD